MKDLFNIGIFVLAIFVLASCSEKKQQYTIELDNGETIIVKAITTTYTKGMKESVLFLDYYVDSLDDIEELSKRAKLIWPHFESMVEKNNMQYGGIRAVKIEHEIKVAGIPKISQSNRYAHIFKKNEKGIWVFLSD